MQTWQYCFKIDYLTIIPRGRVGYELAIIISYPTSASGIIVLLKKPTKSRWISPTRANRKRQGTSAIHVTRLSKLSTRKRTAWTAWMKNQNIVVVAMNISFLNLTHRDSRILHSRTAKKIWQIMWRKRSFKWQPSKLLWRCIFGTAIKVTLNNGEKLLP